MNQTIAFIALTAASIGFVHTLFGPDHYLPFIVMAKAGKWSRAKTFWITAACGLGHVASSIILGFVGIGFGIAVVHLEAVESVRGDIAAWLLTAFGFAYGVWGLWRALRNRPHTHIHLHDESAPHVHEHSHTSDHAHVHGNAKTMTPWILFTIFVFGPCEPLIPLIMYPAAAHSIGGVAAVALVFGIVTIGTMLGIVMLALRGIEFIPMKALERFTHALAGAVLCCSGLAILLLGL